MGQPNNSCMLCFPASSPHALLPKRGLYFKTYLVFYKFSQYLKKILNPKVLYDNCSFELQDVRSRTNRGRRFLSYMRIVVIFHSSVKGIELGTISIYKTAGWIKLQCSHLSLMFHYFKIFTVFPLQAFSFSPRNENVSGSSLFIFEGDIQKHLRLFKRPRILRE